MAEPLITFYCSTCSIRLTVPGHLAGITGPCPSCGSPIRAPNVSESGPNLIQSTPAAVPSPEIQQPVPPAATPPVPGNGSAIHPPPTPTFAAIPSQGPTLPAKPTSLRPPALVLPHSKTPSARVVTSSQPATLPPATSHEIGSENSAPLSGLPSQKSAILRWLFPILLINLVVILGFGGVTFLKRYAPQLPQVQPVSQVPEKKLAPSELVVPPLPTPSIPSEIPNVAPPASEIESPPDAVTPQVAEPVPEPPDDLKAQTPSEAATAVLVQFLSAESLTERLLLAETQTLESELAASCLAKPLPQPQEILIESIETNTTEQVVDFYHQVIFVSENVSHAAQSILVRKRGTNAPKVVVDPFLDSYGQRLAAYAKTPTEKPATFQVTIAPLAGCYDENIPNWDQKLTLKLLPQAEAKEITLAYFGKQSELARMLEDGTYSLSYGKAKACTVMLRWNTQDRAATPYLEATGLKALGWSL